MSIREPNDAGGDADKYNDLDAEWLEGQQDAAYQAAVDASMFDQEVKFDLGTEVARIHSNFCADRGIKQEPYRPSDAEREAVCGGWYSAIATGRG